MSEQTNRSQIVMNKSNVVSNRLKTTCHTNFLGILKSDRTDKGVDKILRYINDNNGDKADIEVKVLERKCTELVNEYNRLSGLRISTEGR